MRSPSARVLINLCTLYPIVPAQDADGSLDVAASYPTAAATLACSYQCRSAPRAEPDGRVTTALTWAVLFATADVAALTAPPKVNDRIDLLAADGVTVFRSVYADGELDYAGRSSTTEIPCKEML